MVVVGCEGLGPPKGPGAPHELPPGMPPDARWVRELGAVDVGPLPWYGADGSLLGAVFASEDSLVALGAGDGRRVAAWPWPEGFRSLTWGQESTSSSAYGLALLGFGLWWCCGPTAALKCGPTLKAARAFEAEA